MEVTERDSKGNIRTRYVVPTYTDYSGLYPSKKHFYTPSSEVLKTFKKGVVTVNVSEEK